MQPSRASLCVAPLLILLLFGSTLTGDSRLAFRDVSHFYTPLYDYVAQRTSENWLPTWNPLDQTGMPLIGETSTAVLYPVRYLLFSLPVETNVAMAWYVVLHLMLASLTAATAARWAGASELASSLAGILYSLSGSVLFLYTNPPFLVGAAWLPLVLGVMMSRQLTDARTRLLVAAPALAMMILGGDPQSALHAMLVVGVFYLIQRIRRDDRNISLASLAAVPTFAALLAAPQIAASVSWSQQSDRLVAADPDQWLEPPTAGTRRYESYEFSLAPWHLAELATPNPSGSLLPVYRRISHLLAGDGRMWTPSIYMSGLLLMAIAVLPGAALRAALDRWMWIAILSIWLSMGHFALGWAIQSATGSLTDVDSAFGGPYWLLYSFFPGYDSFRYPPKWLPIFALSVSIWISRLVEPIALVRISMGRLVGLGGSLLILLCGTLWFRIDPESITGQIAKVPQDEFWGPLDIQGGLSQLNQSITHSIVVIAALVGITRLPLKSNWKTVLLLLVVSADLGSANHDWIAKVPVADEQLLLEHRQLDAPQAGTRWMRTISRGGWPAVWRQSSEVGRLLDVEASQRISQFGRWHLAARTGMVNNMVSIRSARMAEFWSGIEEATADLSPPQRDQFWAGLRRWLSIEGVVHTSDRWHSIPLHDRTALIADVNPSFVTSEGALRFEAGVDQAALAARAAQPMVVRLRDLAAGEFGQTVGGPPSGGAEHVQYDGLELSEPGMASRPVMQDGHWRAEYSVTGENQWRPVDVHQVDRIGQGVFLTAGTWDLRFRYKPYWLVPALGICAVSWMALLWVRIF